MKIAAIVITYNDDYKFKEWCQWYEEYKNQIGLYIIVDNNSTAEYRELVRNYFKDAHIIWRDSNGGCTSAYNDGIRYALSQSDVTHIALIGNDMRLGKNCLIECAKFLDNDEQLGMLAPALLYANTDIVSDYGCGINNDLTMRAYGEGVELRNIKEPYRYCDAVTGGMNISKRSFYETTVGLQDENLFMYSDEVDMAMRAKKAGVKMAVIKEAFAWHNHVISPVVVKRHPYSSFLIARNKVYVANKHFGAKKAKKVFNSFFYHGLIHYVANILKLNFDKAQSFRWCMIGAYKGLKGDMKPNKYSQL